MFAFFFLCMCTFTWFLSWTVASTSARVRIHDEQWRTLNVLTWRSMEIFGTIGWIWKEWTIGVWEALEYLFPTRDHTARCEWTTGAFRGRTRHEDITFWGGWSVSWSRGARWQLASFGRSFSTIHSCHTHSNPAWRTNERAYVANHLWGRM